MPATSRTVTMMALSLPSPRCERRDAGTRETRWPSNNTVIISLADFTGKHTASAATNLTGLKLASGNWCVEGITHGMFPERNWQNGQASSRQVQLAELGISAVFRAASPSPPGTSEIALILVPMVSKPVQKWRVPQQASRNTHSSPLPQSAPTEYNAS